MSDRPHSRPRLSLPDADADKPVFDRGDVSKMGADAPQPWEFEPTNPAPSTRKKIRVRFKTPEQYAALEQRTREEHRKANSGHHRGRRPVGSSGHSAADRISAFAHADGLSMKGGFAKLAPDLEPTKPSPPPPTVRAAHAPGKCDHCHGSMRGKKANAKYCSSYCTTMASRSAKRAAKAEAERVFDPVQMIATNEQAGPPWDESLSPAQQNRYESLVRLGALLRKRENKGPYVTPERGRKRDYSYLSE
jgi:hypothetical protein